MGDSLWRVTNSDATITIMHLSRTTAGAAALALPIALAAVPPAGAAPDDERAPRLRVSTVKSGLDIPWDIAFLPDGGMLYTQRVRQTIRYRGPGGNDRNVRFNRSGMWAAGETGLMSIVASPNFSRKRQFFTCHGSNNPNRAGGHDVRVVKWRLRDNARSAAKRRTIVKGLPASSGRHGGCRIRFGKEGALYIGTGDAAIGKTPQNLRSGGGKVLRVRSASGRPWPGNPFKNAGKAMKRRVYTYGHRNVQGLAQRPNKQMWSVEHGPDRNDEVNKLRSGGNYGWDPRPGYNENVPMTDFSLPGKQVGARWKSGSSTIATSGAVWLRGKKWRAWQGSLAVAALKDTSLRVMKFRPKGKFVRMWTPPALNGSFRLRSPVLGPDRNLYVTTANGGGNDRIFKVVPR